MRPPTLMVCLLLIAPPVRAVELDDFPQNLITPQTVRDAPAPGRRVRQTLPAYAETQVHHTLYLPTDWRPGASYPVIVEYAGNQWKTSPGTVEGSNLGYGLTGGEGAIWLCLPYVDRAKGENCGWWWGEVEATVDYCVEAVESVCDEYGGDKSKVVLAGFSRGAIACNYLGLHDDRIAALWCGFICHSHYDGVREWNYPASDRASAAQRLARLIGRPQFISQEGSVAKTKRYLDEALPDGNFTYQPLPIHEHTDAWTLHDLPARDALRAWWRDLLDVESPDLP
ncbi:hypothetical protein MalM25_30470 [Planctomycetes bacterium MalM25]|nr:hypothetical protein MalM25_30470 [Planctomycetes bacterium MalM25]